MSECYPRPAQGQPTLLRLEEDDVTATVDASVRRYRVEISDKELDDLRSRTQN